MNRYVIDVGSNCISLPVEEDDHGHVTSVEAVEIAEHVFFRVAEWSHEEHEKSRSLDSRNCGRSYGIPQ